MAKERTDSKLERLIKQNRAERRFKVTKDMFASNRFGPLVFLLIFGAIGSLLMFRSFAASDPQAPASKPARIWLHPDRTVTALGSSVTLQVRADDAGQPVSAMQASVEYPSDKLEYVQSDIPDNREVETRVVNTGKRIIITRVGNGGQAAGKGIASLTFRPKAKGNISLKILSDKSEIRRSSDNKNILGASEGALVIVN